MSCNNNSCPRLVSHKDRKLTSKNYVLQLSSFSLLFSKGTRFSASVSSISTAKSTRATRGFPAAPCRSRSAAGNFRGGSWTCFHSLFVIPPTWCSDAKLGAPAGCIFGSTPILAARMRPRRMTSLHPFEQGRRQAVAGGFLLKVKLRIQRHGHAEAPANERCKGASHR